MNFQLFFEILASTYGPGPYGPTPLTILKTNISWICSVSIFEQHTAPDECRKYAPGEVCIYYMVLEHIWLRKFCQIINGPGPWVEVKISKKQTFIQTMRTF